MLQRIRKLRAVEAGFTLIELLIVVVILGVLAGIVVFAVSAFNNDGVTAACKADVKNVQIASEAYYAKNGAYDSGGIADLVTSGYLKNAPGNPTKYTINYGTGANVTGTNLTVTPNAAC